MIEGSFIVIEGIDGAGTTTQADLIASWFRTRGLPAHTTHEPTDGPVGSLIRQVLTNRLVVCGITGPRAPAWTTMALLFAADRLDHLESEILPNLLDGVTVISDRYDLSSLAYQSATATGSEVEALKVTAWVRELNKHARRPDLTIVLDVDAEVAAKRRRKRGSSTELYEETELQRALARAYLQAEKFVPGDTVVHIDGNGPVEQIHQAIVEAVRKTRGEPA
ncbi:MAG: dTMP kinase [Deltaproteobacteria bacterium]|nr:dTMP kinase [Deltaproteobacteria bacterium]